MGIIFRLTKDDYLKFFGLTNFDRYNVGFFHGCILFYGKENKNVTFQRGNCYYARRKLRDFI